MRNRLPFTSIFTVILSIVFLTLTAEERISIDAIVSSNTQFGFELYQKLSRKKETSSTLHTASLQLWL